MIPGDKACYAGSDVLINKFGVKDAEIARAIEYKFASVRDLELSANPIEGEFNFSHLQKIHEHLFQDLYDWAGKTRTVDFAKRSKQTGLVSKFVPQMVMDLKIEEFDRFIVQNNRLRNLPKAEFVKQFAEVYTQLNELHPFREGNGRSTRIFLRELAKQAGYELSIEKIDGDRWNYASHKAMVQYDVKNPDVRLPPNKFEIRQIFHEILTPTREHAFRHETREAAIKHYPELKSVYDRLSDLEQNASKKLAPDKVEKLMKLEHQRIAEKLGAMTKQAELKSTLNQETPTQKVGFDKYQVLANAVTNVLQKKGETPERINRIVDEAHRRLDALQARESQVKKGADRSR